MRQAIGVWRTKYKRVTRITWFLIKDEPPTRASSWQSGLRRLNGTKKPSFSTWQNLKGVVKMPRPAQP
jgi:hypothetical protein